MIKLREDGVPWAEIQKQHFPNKSVSNLVHTYSTTRTNAEDDVWRPTLWSKEEIEQLLTNREEKKMDYKELAELHGRTQASVKNKYRHLVKERADADADEGRKYVSVRSKSIWSEEDEIALVEMLKAGATLKTVQTAFPGRSWRGLQATVHRLKTRDGLIDRKWSPVDQKTVSMMKKMKEAGMTMKEISAMMPEFEHGELRYAYNRSLFLKRKAAGILPGKKKFSRVDEKSLAKLMEMRAENVPWKDILEAMPEFDRAELGYVYYRALKEKKKAEKKDEVDGSEESK